MSHHTGEVPIVKRIVLVIELDALEEALAVLLCPEIDHVLIIVIQIIKFALYNLIELSSSLGILFLPKISLTKNCLCELLGNSPGLFIYGRFLSQCP